MKELLKIFKTKLKTSATDADAHLRFDDKLSVYLLSGVRRNAEKVKVCIHSADEGWIKTLRIPSYFPKTVELIKYGSVTPFLDAVLIPRDCRANVFFLKQRCFTSTKWCEKQRA